MRKTKTMTVALLLIVAGADEIAHFLRVYSYTRGELIPSADVDGRKGIFVPRELAEELRFFKNAGEWFAKDRDAGLRYGQIMALYRDLGRTVEHDIGDDDDQAHVFMPFAGTEGYNPVAYIPYIVAGAVARPLGLKLLAISGSFPRQNSYAEAIASLIVSDCKNETFVPRSMLSWF